MKFNKPEIELVEISGVDIVATSNKGPIELPET